MNLLYAQGGAIEGGPIGSSDVLDGVYVPTHVPLKKSMKYEVVREADYIWGKRVYRKIDLREKMNYPLKYPLDFVGANIPEPNDLWIRNSNRWSLWTIIRYLVMEGKVTVYHHANPSNADYKNGDQFIYPIKSKFDQDAYFYDEAYRKELFRYLGALGDYKINEETGEVLSQTDDNGDPLLDQYGIPIPLPRDTTWLEGGDILGYELKEDWFFDKERSVLDVRIIGIAPIVNFADEYLSKPVTFNEVKNDWNAKIVMEAPLFWLYFPELREYLANYYVYNEDNDAQWMSFDDFFWKRRFSSYILKESNVFDRQVESYRYGIDALIESEAITEEIRTLEHDMWNF